MNESRAILASTPRPGAIVPRDQYLSDNSDRLDLTESISFFRRRLWWIVGTVGLAVLAGLIITLLTEKTYRAEASVMLIQPSERFDTMGDAAVSQPSNINSELVDTQVEIINSREMALRVIDALDLDVGLNAVEQRELIDEVQEDVAAERTGESYALTISFDAPSPQLAARGANEFAYQFANWEVSADKQRNSDSRQLVEQRIAQLRSQAQNDTQALQQYRIANNLLSTSGASLTEQEISNFNQQVATARAEAAESQARLNTALAQLRSGSMGDDTGEALGSAVINSLREQESTLAGQVANLSSRYGPNHPQLIRAQGELNEIRDRIQAEIGRVISNLRAEKAVADQRLSSISGSLAGARGQLAGNNASMVGLIELERAAEASQGIYETYLNRYKQLLAAEGSERPNARILTKADLPFKPRSPNLPLNLALSLVIGLGLGVVVAYVVEALFHGITSASDVRRVLNEHFLASIPLLESVDKDQPHAVAAIREDPRSLFTESFRALEASIDQATRGSAKVVAITSALPGEGKTVSSCCLAHVMAESGARTILIDCDIRRRGISRLLKTRDDQPGLLDILNGEVELDIEQMYGERTFCVIPLSREEELDDHLLTDDRFANFLEKLREHFDHIVLDLPPVLPVAATRAIAAKADAVVMVAKWRKTSSMAIKAALSRLPQDQVNLVGVAITQVDMRKRAFLDRNDSMFYYDKYKEYYS